MIFIMIKLIDQNEVAKEHLCRLSSMAETKRFAVPKRDALLKAFT